ncbi:hypothetical protein B0H14DRAFT_2578871 [Mycena olivaceomarginata]|nr:hypothetical protein B0H14DRAFT_2578871 [Mycena olivaceomarginata]
MAIDPRLSALSSPSSPSPLAPSSSIPPQRPVPRPTYTGSIFGKSNPMETVGEEPEAPSTTNVGGFNFSAISTGSYKPSASFEALRGPISGSEVPPARTPIRTPLRTPTVATGARAGSATKSAAVLAAIIGAPSPGPSVFGASQPTTLSSIVGISSNSGAKRPPGATRPLASITAPTPPQQQRRRDFPRDLPYHLHSRVFCEINGGAGGFKISQQRSMQDYRQNESLERPSALFGTSPEFFWVRSPGFWPDVTLDAHVTFQDLRKSVESGSGRSSNRAHAFSNNYEGLCYVWIRMLLLFLSLYPLYPNAESQWGFAPKQCEINSLGSSLWAANTSSCHKISDPDELRAALAKLIERLDFVEATVFGWTFPVHQAQQDKESRLEKESNAWAEALMRRQRNAGSSLSGSSQTKQLQMNTATVRL